MTKSFGKVLRYRPVRILAGLLLAVTAVLAGLWLWNAAAPGPTGTQLGAFATAISALASAVAALAAWRSAARSDLTSRRAAEALGMAFRPDISGFITSTHVMNGSGGLREETYVEVRNRAQWPAINIVVRHDDGEGWKVEKKFDRLDGAKPPAGQGHRENPAILKALIETPPKRPSPLEDPEWQGEMIKVATTTVEYEDERGLIRWSWSQERESVYGRKGSIESSGGRPRGVSITRMT